MIRHIVLFSVPNPAHHDIVEKGLGLLGNIPESSLFEVRRNTKRDGLSAEMDFVVYAEFPDLDALDRYKTHPLYQDAIAIVRPLRGQRVAVDIEAGGIATPSR